ncbi:MAG: cupin [Gemmatimonadetes bacterium]|nr:MAG: cupin [Gemmatimonadota bacterium]
MRGLLLALAGVVLTAATVTAQVAPVKSGVYHWAAMPPAKAAGGRVERAVFIGSTLDLDSLDVRAITIPATVSADTVAGLDSLETFVLVKEGKLWATLSGVSRSLGAGGVALTLPGDMLVLANTGGVPATYYRFRYRSKAPMDMNRARQAGGSFMVDYADLTEKPTAVGFRRDVLNRPTAMFRRFESHWSSVKAGVRNHATHTHRADEFMMMTKGNVEMLIGQYEPPATIGDVVFLGSMLPHSLLSKGAGPAEYLVIQGE